MVDTQSNCNLCIVTITITVGFSDPYCKFKLGTQKYRSKVHNLIFIHWCSALNAICVVRLLCNISGIQYHCIGFHPVILTSLGCTQDS